MKRTVLAVFVSLAVLLAAGGVRAQIANQKRDQVAAATSRAVEKLRAQIAAEQVGHNTTIGDVLKATNGEDYLTKTLQRSQMIGGPRWIDDQTCQVRLEISGTRVANALIQIVNLNPRKSPIGPDVLAGRLRDWNKRTFSATSSSTGSTVIEEARPIEQGSPWSRVNDDTRQQAIAAAKRNAISGVILAMDPIPTTPPQTIGDAMNDTKTRDAVDQWLAARPVTGIEFNDAMQVAVTLATPPGELADVFLATQPNLDAQARDRVHKAISDTVPAAARGTAHAGDAAPPGPSLLLPANPPAWVNDQVEADGAAASHGSPLKAARLAEADAQVKLRHKIDALPLTDNLTLGQAAQKDPRIEKAVARIISNARASKVDYLPDGGAQVRIALELHDLWEAISAGM